MGVQNKVRRRAFFIYRIKIGSIRGTCLIMVIVTLYINFTHMDIHNGVLIGPKVAQPMIITTKE